MSIISTQLYTRAAPSGQPSEEELHAPDPSPEQAKAAIEGSAIEWGLDENVKLA
jgi:hypothetical protein